LSVFEDMILRSIVETDRQTDRQTDREGEEVTGVEIILRSKTNRILFVEHSCYSSF